MEVSGGREGSLAEDGGMEVAGGRTDAEGCLIHFGRKGVRLKYVWRRGGTEWERRIRRTRGK